MFKKKKKFNVGVIRLAVSKIMYLKVHKLVVIFQCTIKAVISINND